MTWSIYAHGTKEGARKQVERATLSGDEKEQAIFSQVKSMMLTAIDAVPDAPNSYYGDPQIAIVKIIASGHGAMVTNLSFASEAILK